MPTIRTATRSVAILAAALAIQAGPGRTAAGAAAPVASSPEVQAIVAEIALIAGLAAFDPTLAAARVPEPWIGEYVDAVLAVEAEQAEVRGAIPLERPLDAQILAQLDALASNLPPRTIAAVHRSLEPRILRRAAARGADPARFRSAVRTARQRLASPDVLRAAQGAGDVALTETQVGLAKLGPEVVRAVQERLRQLDLELAAHPAPAAG